MVSTNAIHARTRSNASRYLHIGAYEFVVDRCAKSFGSEVLHAVEVRDVHAALVRRSAIVTVLLEVVGCSVGGVRCG